jgi:hypothetical protein
MWVGKLKQTARGEVADYFCERDIMYRMAKLEDQEVVKPHPVTTAATQFPITFGELMQTLDLIHRL